MKKTILERIANLQEMIDRRESAFKVKAEVHAIFEMINKEEDKQIKDKALDAMLSLAFNMVTELDELPLTRLLDILQRKEKTRVIPVTVHVHEYIDAIVIETDKKIPYSNLMTVINKAVPKFEDNIDEIKSICLNKKDNQIEIDFKNVDNKSIILSLEKWNLNIDCMEIYVEGFVEYIKK